MKRECGTGSLKVRKGVYWLRYRHRGKRVEESSGIRNDGTPEAHAKALKALRSKCKVADTPVFVAPAAAKVTFEDLCTLLKADYQRKGRRSARRLEGAHGPVGHLAETFSGRRALAITAIDVDRYADERLAAGAQPATVNRELAALRRMFKLALKKAMLPTAPAIELRPEDNARQGFLDPGDFDAFLAELRQRDTVVADVTETAYFTCLRRGNVLGLTWPMLAPEVRDGALVGGELRLPGRMTKNKKPLTLPLTGRLLEVLARRWPRPPSDGPVSCSTTCAAQVPARCAEPGSTS
jgi:integrase